jgi:hypothetical protein
VPRGIARNARVAKRFAPAPPATMLVP